MSLKYEILNLLELVHDIYFLFFGLFAFPLTKENMLKYNFLETIISSNSRKDSVDSSFLKKKIFMRENFFCHFQYLSRTLSLFL